MRAGMRAMLRGLDLVDEWESLQTALLAIALKSARNETYQLLRRIVCKIRKLKVEALRKLENLRDKHAKPVLSISTSFSYLAPSLFHSTTPMTTVAVNLECSIESISQTQFISLALIQEF